MIFFPIAWVNHPSSILSVRSVAFLRLEKKFQAAGRPGKQEEECSSSWKTSVKLICYTFFTNFARSCRASIQRLRVVWPAYVLYKGSWVHLTACNGDALKCYCILKYYSQLAVKTVGTKGRVLNRIIASIKTNRYFSRLLFSIKR